MTTSKRVEEIANRIADMATAEASENDLAEAIKQSVDILDAAKSELN